MLPSLHLFRTGSGDRVAVVSVAPASAAGQWMIRVGRGASREALTGGMVYGPFPTGVVRARYDEAVANLEAEGFARSGRSSLIEALDHESPTVRARAALRLGWRRERSAVGPLLAALERKKRDAPAILDALGWIGDDQAIDAIRPYAERKLLSRRRSGVEALRNLGDAVGLADARQRGLERLPANVVSVLATLDEHDVRKANLTPLLAALDEIDVVRRGRVADALYEADTPATLAAARRLLRIVPLHEPEQWRYAKSIFKRTMVRHDARTFGWIAHAIERRARVVHGTTAVLKSGLDGKARATPVFGKKTQAYVRRASWRYLRDLARWRPDLYAQTAAEVLVRYGVDDLRPPKGKTGRHGECYLLARILFAGGDRYRFDTRAMRVRFRSAKAALPPPPGAREESFPERWDASPSAYLRVASGGQLPVVLDFAAAGLARHPSAIREARTKDLLGMLASGHAMLAGVARDELDRRFDPAAPDVAVVRRLLGHESPEARALGLDFAERSAERWALRPSVLIELLLSAQGGDGVRLAQAAAAVLERADAAQRHTVAAAIVSALSGEESPLGAHAPLAELARRALLSELDAALSTTAIVAMLESGSNAARGVAGALLGRRPEAFEVLGTDRLRAMAESELVLVRRGAHALLSSAAEHLRDAPGPLFVLAESRWEDTREVAFALIRELGFSSLGLAGLIGLCDSAQPPARALGRELVTRYFEELDAQEVLYKLAEHPARDMRRFAMTLLSAHLAPGFVALTKVEGFVRAALFDPKPDLAVIDALIDLLRARGEADERQAELAVALLERVAVALAQIQQAHPVADPALQPVASAGSTGGAS